MKKSKTDPNAPSLTRIPLPELWVLRLPHRWQFFTWPILISMWTMTSLNWVLLQLHYRSYYYCYLFLLLELHMILQDWKKSGKAFFWDGLSSLISSSVATVLWKAPLALFIIIIWHFHYNYLHFYYNYLALLHVL